MAKGDKIELPTATAHKFDGLLKAKNAINDNAKKGMDRAELRQLKSHAIKKAVTLGKFTVE